MIRVYGSAGRVTAGLGLIGYGVWAVLYAFAVLPIGAGAALNRYWPALFVLWGVLDVLDGLLAKKGPRRLRGLPLVVAAVALVLLAQTLGFVHSPLDSFWTIVWAAAAVVVGLSLIGVRFGTDGMVWSNWGHKSASGGLPHDVWVGSVSLGQDDGWQVEDRVYRQGLGDLNLDLTHARLKPGETRLELHAAVGDIQVLLPPDLPVHLEGQVSIGEVRFFGQETSGIERHLDYETPDYAAATHRLRMEMYMRMGDITVERVT